MAKESSSRPRGKAGQARVASVKKDVIAALKTDLTIKAIADAYDIGTHAVSRIAREAGIERGEPNPKKGRRQDGQTHERTPHRKYTPAEKAPVLADVASLGYSGAARKHGLKESTVRYWAINGNASSSIVVASNGSNGKGDIVAAINGVLRLLEPLSTPQRLKLLDAAKALVA